MSTSTESPQRRLRMTGKQQEEISIIFRPDEEVRPFHCPTCGCFQFNRKLRIMAMLELGMEQVLLVPPISPVCRRCGCIFHCFVL